MIPLAERSVIREDVVSIGFEVENNPFGDLAKEIDGLMEEVREYIRIG